MSPAGVERTHPAMIARPRPDPAMIEAAIEAALDEAGIAGLCQEGQIEAAVGRVAQRWPAIARDELIEAAMTCAAARARTSRP